MVRFILVFFLLLSFDTPARAASSAVEMQLRYLEKDLDRLLREEKTRFDQLQKLEIKIAALQAEIAEIEKAATGDLKEKLDKQDKRIEDLSLILADGANKISVSSYLATWASVLITLSLFVVTAFMGLRVPQQAKEAAREKAEEITEKSVRAAKDQAKDIAKKISTEKSEELIVGYQKSFQEKIDLFYNENILPTLEDIKEKAKTQRDDINRLNKIEIERMRDLTKIVSIKDKNEDRALNLKYKVENILSIDRENRTLAHWHALLSYYYEVQDYKEMEQCSEDALKSISLNAASKVQLLNLQAVSKEKLNKIDDAISILNEIINEFGGEKDVGIIDEVATSYINKGVNYSKKYLIENSSNKYFSEMAVKSFDEAVDFCKKHDALQKKHAIALFYKGSAQEEDLLDESSAKYTFNQYLSIFSESDDPEIKAITKKVRTHLIWLDPSSNSA